MEAEGYLSREQIMARIFETAEREAWPDEKLSFRIQRELRIEDSALKHIMRVYRAYKNDEKITEAQWREVLNAWRNDEESKTGPYKALLCYEAAKWVERELRFRGISVQWKTGGDYDHTVRSVEEYLKLERGPGTDILAAIEEILKEREIWGIRAKAKARDFLEELRETEIHRRSVFD